MNLGVAFAFAAAIASALNIVTQHVASTAAPTSVKGWRLARYLVRSPLWLFGVGAVITSFGCQAIALYQARVSLVQSILVTELVFSLVIGQVWLRRTIPLAAWSSASVTCVGLAIFIVMSEPKGGHPDATSGAWLPALLTFGGLATLSAGLATRGSPTRRAALYASASAIVSALLATFLKSTTEVLATNGIFAVLTRGEVYALIAAGVAGTFLTQSALHHGPLSVAQGLMVIVNPVVSVILGIWLYGEQFVGGAGRIVAGLCGFATMALGAVFLARTTPSFAAKSEPVSASTQLQ